MSACFHVNFSEVNHREDVYIDPSTEVYGLKQLLIIKLPHLRCLNERVSADQVSLYLEGSEAEMENSQRLDSYSLGELNVVNLSIRCKYSLKCSLCCKPYRIGVEVHQPCSLQCGHSVCRSCLLSGLADESEDGKRCLQGADMRTVCCPIEDCSRVTYTSLNEEVRVSESLETLLRQPRERMLEERNSVLSPQECFGCHEEASIYCPSCTHKYCRDCDQHFHKPEKTNRHNRSPILSCFYERLPVQCSSHESEICRFFCFDDNASVCERCVSEGGSHFGHKFKTTADSNESKRIELDEKRKILLEAQAKLWQVLDESEKSIRELVTAAENEEEALLTRCEKLVAFMKEWEAIARLKLWTRFADDVREVKKVRDQVGWLLSEVATGLIQLDNLLETEERDHDGERSLLGFQEVVDVKGASARSHRMFDQVNAFLSSHPHNHENVDGMDVLSLLLKTLLEIISVQDNIRTQDVQCDHATITWDTVVPCSISSSCSTLFHLELRCLNDSGKFAVVHEGPDQVFVATGLKPLTKYEATVQPTVRMRGEQLICRGNIGRVVFSTPIGSSIYGITWNDERKSPSLWLSKDKMHVCHRSGSGGNGTVLATKSFLVEKGCLAYFEVTLLEKVSFLRVGLATKETPLIPGKLIGKDGSGATGSFGWRCAQGSICSTLPGLKSIDDRENFRRECAVDDVVGIFVSFSPDDVEAIVRLFRNKQLVFMFNLPQLCNGMEFYPAVTLFDGAAQLQVRPELPLTGLPPHLQT